MNFSEQDKLLIASILENEFQSDGSFLSHLTGSMPYDVYEIGDIKNLINPTATPQALNATSDFSNLIHQIPKSQIFRRDNNLLWENYYLLFNKVKLATDSEDGKKVSSEMPEEMADKYKKYKEIREELFVALTEYNKAVFASNSDKTLRNNINQKIEIIQKKWQENDLKKDVDAYIDAKIVSNTLTFSSLWALWKGKFSEFLSVNSDLKGAGSNFATFHAPFDELLNNQKWQQLDFTHNTITQVLPTLPFKNQEEKISNYVKTIENTGLEFIKLDIERPWFIPQIFEVRFWKMSANFKDEIVSDGKLSGTIPAYIESVVFIRNFQKQERKNIIMAGLDWLGGLVYNKIYKPESINPDTIYLAAMVCKTVPKCPNLDTNLLWT